MVTRNQIRSACRCSSERGSAPGDASGAKLATIVLADEHKLVRTALRVLLESAGGVEVVAEASNVGETVRKARAYKPNVLVLDVNMPGGSGLEAIPCLVEASPRTAIVVLTMYRDPRVAAAALRQGACAFVLKDDAESEFVAAVHAAVAGHSYLNPELGARIAARPAIDPVVRDGLTRRELEVLRLVASGHTNSEIADQLCVSARTVEYHRAKIRHKVHRKSRAELVAYAGANGLIDEYGVRFGGDTPARDASASL